MDYSFCFHFWTSTAVCEISGRPIDNVYVKSSWSMSNFQNVNLSNLTVLDIKLKFNIAMLILNKQSSK
jgi:hypothetical protein